MTARKAVPSRTQVAVLTKSGRRCALCFGLHGDARVKQGQIAHVDRDAANAEEDNLVFLCLAHHDEYDATRSQSKGYTPGELREYRQRLYKAIDEGLLPPAGGSGDAQPSAGVAPDLSQEVVDHERAVFAAANGVLSEETLRRMLDELARLRSFHNTEEEAVVELVRYFDLEQNRFITQQLRDAAFQVCQAAGALVQFFGHHFHAYPRDQPGNRRRYCLEPGLCYRLEGDGTKQGEYDALANQLDHLGEELRRSFADYRRLVKRLLIR